MAELKSKTTTANSLGTQTMWWFVQLVDIAELAYWKWKRYTKYSSLFKESDFEIVANECKLCIFQK
jgi:hypothetical protein